MKTKTSKTLRFFLTFAVGTAIVRSQSAETVTLPRISVYSQRVALQEPSAGAFAMPVSALGFEPLVDVQARNMGEAQADVTLRGGIFENTGYRAGAAPLYDPQTGHYAAEIPMAPPMLGAPEIVTGDENALRGWNANAGTVAYSWKRIATTGAATAAGGDYDTWRGEIYQGWVAPESARVLGRRLAFDAALACADSDGSLAWGESRFARYNLRAQLSAPDGGQTDLFFGRQTKFIGWPNLYTPYANVFETDDLQTTLVALNHRELLGNDGDYFSAGIAWRKNKDHYVFNRADPGAYNPAFATGPAWHTTEVWSAGAETRVSVNQIRVNASVAFVADELESTALIYGRFNTRSYFKAALAPERTWALGGERKLTARAGAVFDDTNRDGAAWSPLVSVELAGLGAVVESLRASWNQSSQVPTYTALNSRASAGLFRGNPNLGRENSDNFEIGAHFGRGGVWSADATAFYRRDGDLVDWVYSSQLPNARVASAVDVNTLGFELTARYAAAWCDVVLGYTVLSKDADYASGGAGGVGRVDASFYALNYARHRVTLAIVARPARGVEIRIDNEARLQAANALRRSGDEALLMSAGVFWAVPGIRGLRLFGQITNAWNSDFEEVPAVPAARRQWCAGVTAAW